MTGHEIEKEEKEDWRRWRNDGEKEEVKDSKWIPKVVGWKMTEESEGKGKSGSQTS